MHETLTMILAGAAGLVLGAIFFGGLWWTVRKGVSSPRPALWFLGSLLPRMRATSRAWELKESFRQFWRYRSETWAAAFLKVLHVVLYHTLGALPEPPHPRKSC